MMQRQVSSLLPVTVAIPVKNEEANLPRCLRGLQRFAEVVVLDSGSTDNTRTIAESFGARVLDFSWNGRYPKKRNWYLLNSPPTQCWVLFLDADEFVDDAFCDSLGTVLMDTDCNAFWLKYRNVFLGRELRYGVEQKKLALFRVGKALYERIEEESWSAFDMEIHEHPIVDGKVGVIPVSIEHQDYKGLSKFIEKHRNYAQWEVQRFRMVQEKADSVSLFTARQQFKYRHMDKWWYPWLYFVFTYFAKGGFLDGAAGFYYAFYKLWYFQTIRLLLNEAFRDS